MAINYDFYKTTGVLAADDKWYVRAVDNGTAETEELMQYIQEGTTLTTSDLKGALDALAVQIRRQLADGRNVHIEGLGHFSLSIGGEVTTDSKGRLRLKQPAVRTVNFRPDAGLLRHLSNASFTSSAHRGRHSEAVSEAELPAAIDRLCATTGHFTAAQFRKALRLTSSTAGRLLRRLCSEGRLVNIGSRSFGLYCRAEQAAESELA